MRAYRTKIPRAGIPTQRFAAQRLATKLRPQRLCALCALQAAAIGRALAEWRRAMGPAFVPGRERSQCASSGLCANGEKNSRAAKKSLQVLASKRLTAGIARPALCALCALWQVRQDFISLVKEH